MCPHPVPQRAPAEREIGTTEAMSSQDSASRQDQHDDRHNDVGKYRGEMVRLFAIHSNA